MCKSTKRNMPGTASTTTRLLQSPDRTIMVKFQQRYQMRHGKSRDEDARWGFNSAISVAPKHPISHERRSLEFAAGELKPGVFERMIAKCEIEWLRIEAGANRIDAVAR
jgi:hypothetical protein